MDARREIEALVAFEGRLAGTDAERRAADHLADRLRALGRDAHVEPVSVWPNYALTHLIHALLAIVASVVSVAAPLVGVVLAALATLSTLGDMTGTLFLVRRLTGRRASQNVTSREDAGRPGTLVLVAHYDTARGGSIFSRRVIERRATLAQRLNLPIGLGGLFALAIVVVLVCTVLRGLGMDTGLVAVVQFVATVPLILSVPLLGDIQLSPPSPGAADNASGVAAVLRLAERYDGDLQNFDLWVLFTGAEESMSLGMREWLRAHRWQLPKESTVFINVDKAGNGTVRYAAREGLLIAAPHDRGLLELCDEIAAGDGERRFGARRTVHRATSDALVARSRGYRAVTVSALSALDYQPNQHQPSDTSESLDPEALQRVVGFCSELIEAIDDRLGGELEGSRSQDEDHEGQHEEAGEQE